MKTFASNKREFGLFVVAGIAILGGMIFNDYLHLCCVSILCFLGMFSLQLPKKLCDPRNIVFLFYFLWYGIAPFLKAVLKIEMYDWHVVKNTYFMIIITYTVIMLTLYYTLGYDGECNCQNIMSGIKLSKFEEIGLIIIYIYSISMYIARTGGILAWLTDANTAFFNRKGSGVYYLLFEYAMLLLLYFKGKEKVGVIYYLLCLVTMFFCGSKSIAILFVVMLLSDKVMQANLLTRLSMIFSMGGAIVFYFGMLIRERGNMDGLVETIITFLKYFDTFDNMLLLLNDYPHSFMKTILLPMNWVLQKLNVKYFIGVPYHDTSIWLTTIYFPESWANGGTRQWPLEAYLYLNFKFWWGLPLVVVYFYCIAYLYKRALKQNGIIRFIYLLEFVNILSHLRGGLFNYWYIYLLPFYCVLLIWENKKKVIINT